MSGNEEEVERAEPSLTWGFADGGTGPKVLRHDRHEPDDQWVRHGVANIQEERQNNVVGFGRPEREVSGDGRTLRRERNRDSVIAALIELVRQGQLEPTVADIADLAGVSHRSVFRYFDDLDDLFRTAVDYAVRDALPLAAIPELGEGTLERRVDAFVDSRLRVYAATHMVGRVARYRAATVEAIDNSLRTIVELQRTQARNHFEPELAAMEQANAEFVLDAITTLTSFEAYDTHRRAFGHGTERIRMVWNTTVTRLLS